MEDRTAIMQQDVLLVAIAGLSLLAGMHFSPYFEPAHILFRPFLASFFITSPLLSLYFTSLMLSVGAALIGGLPAAAFERVTGRDRSDVVSLLIWLGGVALIAIPAAIWPRG